MTLHVLDFVPTFDLADSAVVVAGDWHGNSAWMGRALPAAARTGASKLLHVGDFGFWPGRGSAFLAAVDEWAAQTRRHPVRAGIDQVLVAPGNHDDGAIQVLLAQYPGHAIRLSEVVWAAPRGFRLTVADRSVMMFGGASSIDFTYRAPELEWWASELPTRFEVEEAVADGHVDVLVTHDIGELSTPAVSKIVAGPSPWTELERGYAAVSRARITELVNGVTPLVQLAGHYHRRDTGVHNRPGLPPLRVEALGMDGQAGNLVLLDLASLSVAEVRVP